jgi:type IV pilus assembly protein PilM
MALPFIDSGSKAKRDQVVAVDLGGRTTKAVSIQRRGDGFVLSGYTMMDAPVYEKSLPVELLTEHLQAISQALGGKTKSLALTVGVNDAVVRPVEMPRMPIEDMRQVLKLNSRTYLQQELSNYVFDCHPIISLNRPATPDANAPAASVQKQKVLVAGAKQPLITELTEGAKAAGMSADCIVPGLIGPVNSFEMSVPGVFTNEAIALVDIGFKNSTICLLLNGEFILNRTVSLGGDRLTVGLSESMNISYAEAEGIKVGVAHEVQSALESTLTPLGRELRASIDFFEHQHDRTVSQIYICGGSSRSEVIMNVLQAELMVECKTWNPVSVLKLELPANQAGEIEQVAPQLVTAVGAALVAL